MNNKPFKILGISSGRSMGNSEIVMKEALAECEKLAECQVHFTRLRTLKIQDLDTSFGFLKEAAEGKDGCCNCGDDFEWLKEQILWADAVIFSGPCFMYMCTGEVVTLMNRGLGVGKSYAEACRSKKRYLGLICAGGSDTIEFTLPLMYRTMDSVCPGIELTDQFYANWVRGKGFVTEQPWILERAGLMAKRIVNKLQGYTVPPVKTVIRKLNPLESRDDKFMNLEGCPVCRQSVVQVKDTVFDTGKFKCAVCGARGHFEYHGGDITCEWDDDSVAHNYLTEEYREKVIADFAKAHEESSAEKETVKEFPFLTPQNYQESDKGKLIAVVAGDKGGTSELLARRALEEASGLTGLDGAIIRIQDLNIKICTGCLVCKINARYRGGIDECIIRDDDLWLVDRLLEARGVIWSYDAVNGFTYGKLVNFLQRFGHFSRTMRPRTPTPNAALISGFNDEVENAVYVSIFLSRFFTSYDSRVAKELFANVPLTGDTILQNPEALARAGRAGQAVGRAVNLIAEKPENTVLLKTVKGVCPSCGLDHIVLHTDMHVSCVHCDAEGRIEHRFGENVIIWDPYSVDHSRATKFGAMLHEAHINFSQTDDWHVLDNPKIHETAMAPYKEFDADRLIRPSRGPAK